MKNNKKDKIINFRVNEVQKNQITENAQKLGLSVGEYLLYLDNNKVINIIDGGKELAKEIFELNLKLTELERYPFIEVNKIRNLVSESLIKLNSKIKD